ncbi:MAG: hypothetical protein GX493_07905 [Firmicutes bacterium]|nr:hypothetical protein [Bacillota bacterium]
MQRYLSGPLVFTVSLAKEGKVFRAVVFEALRVYPRMGGTSSLRVVIQDPEAEEYDRRFIRHLNWTGFFCADYIRDESTGRLALIELNPRMAPGLILAHHAGGDLFGAYIDLILGRPVRDLRPAVPGTMVRMHFLEIGATLEAFFERGLPFRQKIALWDRSWPRPVVRTTSLVGATGGPSSPCGPLSSHGSRGSSAPTAAKSFWRSFSSMKPASPGTLNGISRINFPISRRPVNGRKSREKPSLL